MVRVPAHLPAILGQRNYEVRSHREDRPERCFDNLSFLVCRKNYGPMVCRYKEEMRTKGSERELIDLLAILKKNVDRTIFYYNL